MTPMINNEKNNKITTTLLVERTTNHRAASLMRASPSRGVTNTTSLTNMNEESDFAIHDRTKAKVLLQMAPTLRRAIQILTGMIACPEGGVKTKLLYTIGEVEGLSPEVKTKLLTCIKAYCNDVVKLEDTLHDMIYRTISEEGADVEVYLPFSMVQTLLGVESDGTIPPDSVDKPPVIVYSEKTHISFSNDMKQLTKTTLPLKGREVLGTEADSADTVTRAQQRLTRISREVLSLNTVGNTPDVSGTIIRKGDASSIIPIEYNGKPLVYIGILDDMGHFLTNTDRGDFIDLMGDTEMGEGDNDAYGMLKSDAEKDKPETNKRFKELRNQIESDVIAQLFQVDEKGNKRNSAIQGVIKSLGDENVLDILTARSLAALKTRVIMIDPEYVSYFALLTNDNGRGINIITDNSSIIILHVTLLYAKILSELENSIPQTKARVRLDPNDTMGDETLRDILGTLTDDITPEYKFNYKGNSPLFKSLAAINTSIEVENVDLAGVPNMDVKIERTNRDVQASSSDLLELVGKFANQAIGVSSENVDSSYGERFKLQVTRDNDITNRQLALYTGRVNTCITERGVKRISHNDTIWHKLCAIIDKTDSEPEEGQVVSGLIEGTEAPETTDLPEETPKPTPNIPPEDMLISVLAKLGIELPEPASTQLEGFEESMTKVTGALDTYIDAAITDAMTDSGSLVDRDAMGAMRSIIKGACVRSYAATTGAFDGIGLDLTTIDSMSNIVLEELGDYGEAFTKMIPALTKLKYTLGKGEGDANAQTDAGLEQSEIDAEKARVKLEKKRIEDDRLEKEKQALLDILELEEEEAPEEAPEANPDDADADATASDADGTPASDGDTPDVNADDEAGSSTEDDLDLGDLGL